MSTMFKGLAGILVAGLLVLGLFAFFVYRSRRAQRLATDACGELLQRTFFLGPHFEKKNLKISKPVRMGGIYKVECSYEGTRPFNESVSANAVYTIQGFKPYVKSVVLSSTASEPDTPDFGGGNQIDNIEIEYAPNGDKLAQTTRRQVRRNVSPFPLVKQLKLVTNTLEEEGCTYLRDEKGRVIKTTTDTRKKDLNQGLLVGRETHEVRRQYDTSGRETASVSKGTSFSRDARERTYNQVRNIFRRNVGRSVSTRTDYSATTGKLKNVFREFFTDDQEGVMRGVASLTSYDESGKLRYRTRLYGARRDNDWISQKGYIERGQDRWISRYDIRNGEIVYTRFYDSAGREIPEWGGEDEVALSQVADTFVAPKGDSI